jgi:OPT oligopeptide transporter protein
MVVLLIALPFGKGLEMILPVTKFKTFGRTWSLNPGPFNTKEHVCITVMVGVSGAYATIIPASQIYFYNQKLTLFYQILLATSIQVIGFSIGGLIRPFVVWPPSVIWPGTLLSSVLFNTLHKNFGKRDRGHMTSQRFFYIATACSFIWYWVPGYLFTALSVFNWPCWIAPSNVIVNTLFGSRTGLGMGILTFDWSTIANVDNPLATPVSAEIRLAYRTYWL